MNCLICSGKVLCIITGGSKGFGRALAIAFSQTLEDGSCIALIARNEPPLQDVKSEILQNNSRLAVFTATEDLSKVTSENAAVLLRKVKGNNNFDRIILVHNVGSLGDISRKVSELNDLTFLQDYTDLNVCSVFTFTAAFLNLFQELSSQENSLFIVNVTSLAAIQPFPGWAQYCSGKAAREMYFKVLAEEFPNITVLNYAPGPMETDMTTQIQQSALPQIQEWFRCAKLEGRLLSCESSAKRLLYFLKAGKYKSGDRVDYYDITMETS